MWETAQGVPAVVPPPRLLLGLLLDPAHSGQECRLRTGLPQPRRWKADSAGFPRRPHPPLHVGRAVPTPPLTCAAAADRASLKSPSGISFELPGA